MYNDYESEFTFDEPVNVNGLLIYPIILKQYYQFNACSKILAIKKNSIADVKVIQMSYLEFILSIIQDNSEISKEYSVMLYGIFSMCLRKNDFTMNYGLENNKIYLEVDNVKLFSSDFELVRKLIMEQNIPDYKEEYINPELEADLEEADRIRSGNKKQCSIEKQLVAVSIGTSMSIEAIKLMTIRKFLILLEMIDKKMHYIMLRTASLSGMVEFKTPVNHYLIEDNNNTIDNKVMNYDTLQKKING